MPTARELVIELSIMVGIGVLLAALGPFGSFIGSFASRLAYWLPAVLIGYAIFRPLAIVSRAVGERLHLPRAGATYVGTIIAAIPATLAIAILGGFSFSRQIAFEQLFQLFLNVALIGLVVATLFQLVEAARTPRASLAAAEPERESDVSIAEPSRAAFLNRLPPAWADRLVALEMEDHYIRAHGPDASALILLRMRDAETELVGVDGLRVHRSWWVARSAVERAIRDGRGYRLRLTNGLEPPVARDRVAALRAAGWLG